MLKSDEIKEKIAKKKEQITKREQLKAKYIAKTEPTDFWYNDEIRNHDNKLSDLNWQLNKLNEQLETQLNKENVPKIPAIEELLNQWEKSYREYIIKCKEILKEKHKAYELAKQEFYKQHPNYNYGSAHCFDKENYKLYQNSVEKLYFEYKKYYATHIEIDWDSEKLEREIILEKQNKRVDLINRVTKVVGEIKDVDHLHFGDNSGINGKIIGSKCSANVETIYAGGYNIQCLHFRVLIKPIK